jgi:hypothetical protein
MLEHRRLEQLPPACQHIQGDKTGPVGHDFICHERIVPTYAD